MADRTMEDSWKALLQRVAAAKQSQPDHLAAFAEALADPLAKIVFYDDMLEQGQYLVHYTSWEHTLQILKECGGPTLRMYNYESSNDPQEGKVQRRAWKHIGEQAGWLDDYLPQHEKTLLKFGRSTGSTYGCSFSVDVGGVEDNLTFWRLYGNDGKGCSFKVTGQLGTVYRVRYLQEDGTNVKPADEFVDERIASWLAQLLSDGQELVQRAVDAGRRDIAGKIATGVRRILGGYHHLAKSRYFEDEREWRMIEVAPEDKSVKYDPVEHGVIKRYIHGLSLKDALVTASSITIGPRVPNGGAARAYVEHLLKKRDMHVPDVKLSEHSYGSHV